MGKIKKKKQFYVGKDAEISKRKPLSITGNANGYISLKTKLNLVLTKIYQL